MQNPHKWNLIGNIWFLFWFIIRLGFAFGWTCNKSPFPKYLGGPAGPVYLHAIDVSLVTGNIAVAGDAGDSSLIPSLPTA